MPTKAKEAPLHKIRLAPLDTDPVFQCLGDKSSAIPSLFNGLEMLSSASDKAKLYAETLSINYNLEDSYLFTCFSF